MDVISDHYARQDTHASTLNLGFFPGSGQKHVRPVNSQMCPDKPLKTPQHKLQPSHFIRGTFSFCISGHKILYCVWVASCVVRGPLSINIVISPPAYNADVKYTPTLFTIRLSISLSNTSHQSPLNIQQIS